MKTNNIIVALLGSHDRASLTNDIWTYMGGHPAETYVPLSLPDIIDESIITVRLQSLPDIGLLPDLNNLNIKLIVYGKGGFFFLLLVISWLLIAHIAEPIRK